MFHTNCILEIRGLNESVSVLASQHRNAYLLVEMRTYMYIHINLFGNNFFLQVPRKVFMSLCCGLAVACLPLLRYQLG